jgi:hypothetical protein
MGVLFGLDDISKGLDVADKGLDVAGHGVGVAKDMGILGNLQG